MMLAEIIESTYSVGLLVLGISMVVQKSLWTTLLESLLKNPHKLLLVGMVELPFGLLAVYGHNYWRLDLSVIITILGWGMTLESLFYLTCSEQVGNWYDGEDRTPIKSLIGLLGIVATICGGLAVYHAYWM